MAGAIAGGATLGAAIGFTAAAVYLVPGAAVLLAVRLEQEFPERLEGAPDLS